MSPGMALGRFLALGEILGGSFGCGLRLALAAEGSLEIEVGAEIVGGRRRSALGAGRKGRAAIGSPRFLAFRLLALGFAGRLRGLGFGRGGRGRLVEQQVFGRNLGFGPGLGPQIDAEQVFGQGLPGIFFAARAGAQRIGVHRALITIVKRTRGSVTSEKSLESRRERKALAGK